MFKELICTTHRTLQWFCLKLISFYRFCVSPFLGNHCRFYPSCSAYAMEAFTTHSVFKAFYLTGWRLLRCNPLSKGGCDPVHED